MAHKLLMMSYHLLAIENLPAWYLPCGWCRDQVAYAVYGRVFQRGSRFFVDAAVDEE
jgi:hypothetical protein